MRKSQLVSSNKGSRHARTSNVLHRMAEMRSHYIYSTASTPECINGNGHEEEGVFVPPKLKPKKEICIRCVA